MDQAWGEDGEGSLDHILSSYQRLKTQHRVAPPILFSLSFLM